MTPEQPISARAANLATSHGHAAAQGGARALLAILVTAATVAGVLFAGCRVPHPRGRWNVVVVLVDTLRADHLGAYGYPRGTSPNLDALAARSYLFERSHAQASCTYPSVNSILTGRYPAIFLGQPGHALGIPPDVRSIAEILAARGWSTAAVSASGVVRATPGRVNRTGGFGRGFARFDEDCQGRPAPCVTSHAFAALDRLREPFFLYLHYLDPHAPYTPPRDLRRRFLQGESTKRWVRRGDPNPISDMLYDAGPPVEYTPQDLAFLRGLYDGEIASFDRQLARLLATLERRGLLDRTIFAFVADHGESFLEHGDIKHCRSLYESEVHTPFLLHLPRQRDGERRRESVQNVDLVPTLLDLLGVPLTGERLDGSSLVPLLDDDAGTAVRYGYSLIGSRRSVTDGRWKLLHDLRGGRWELYDLQDDPGEHRDVANVQREVFARLRNQLLGWVRRNEGISGADRGEDALRRLKALGYL